MNDQTCRIFSQRDLYLEKEKIITITKIIAITIPILRRIMFH